MGLYVHISVVFAYDGDDEATEIANKYLEKDWSQSGSRTEIVSFLEHLRDKHHTKFSPKGGTFYWGGIGNYTDTKEFVEDLRPFWKELLVAKCSPMDFEHILVFTEREGMEYASAFEIWLDEDKDVPEKYELITTWHSRLPFAWMQF